MKFRLFMALTILMTVLFALNASARKPAVESFAGVEPESYNETSQGMEVQFNFGNHVFSNLTSPKTIKSQTAQTPNWLATSTLVAFIMLPFFMWFGISHSLKEVQVISEAVETVAKATQVESEPTPENVKHLKDYKKDSDKKDGGKKAA